MIEIDAVTLRLPHFLAPHAETIARAVAQAIAEAEPDAAGRIEHVGLPPLELQPGTPLNVVTRELSRHVVRSLGRVLP